MRGEDRARRNLSASHTSQDACPPAAARNAVSENSLEAFQNPGKRCYEQEDLISLAGERWSSGRGSGVGSRRPSVQCAQTGRSAPMSRQDQQSERVASVDKVNFALLESLDLEPLTLPAHTARPARNGLANNAQELVRVSRAGRASGRPLARCVDLRVAGRGGGTCRAAADGASRQELLSHGAGR